MMISFVLVVAVMTGISAFLFGPTIWGAANMLGGVLLGLIVVALSIPMQRRTSRSGPPPKPGRRSSTAMRRRSWTIRGQLLARPQRNVLITARREVLQEALAEERKSTPRPPPPWRRSTRRT